MDFSALRTAHFHRAAPSMKITDDIIRYIFGSELASIEKAFRPASLTKSLQSASGCII